MAKRLCAKGCRPRSAAKKSKSCPKGVVKSGPRKGKCRKVRRARKSR